MTKNLQVDVSVSKMIMAYWYWSVPVVSTPGLFKASPRELVGTESGQFSAK